MGSKLKNNLKLSSFPLALVLIAKTGAIASAQIVPDNTLPQNSDAGNLRVKADEIELIAGSRDFGSSGLFASADFDSTGNGGNLDIEADYLYIADGAQAIAATFGEGDAGNLTVKANEIELIGTSPGGNPSGLFSSVEKGATGNGGNISVTTEQFLVTEGSEIAVSTAGSGTGGNISITTEQLLVTEGSQIVVSTAGSRNAGILNIEASNVELIGSSEFDSSGLFSNAIIDSGDGGNINLKSDRLTILDGATISAGNFSSSNPDIPPGTGIAGNIKIEVNSLKLDRTSSEIPSSITASTNAGGGGDINLATDFLFLENNSLISTSVLDSTGGGGNLTIDGNYIIAQDNSDLRANAVLGQGGNIDITTEVILLSLDSDVDASSEFGLDGVVEIKSPDSDEQIGIVRFSETITDPTGLIWLINSSAPAIRQARTICSKLTKGTLQRKLATIVRLQK